MKAYQVFAGEEDKYGHQRYDLVAIYLDKERALSHCKQIAESNVYKDEILEEGEFYGGPGVYKNWDLIGWSRVTIARFAEIDITE
jgi:hypothetical protein